MKFNIASYRVAMRSLDVWLLAAVAIGAFLRFSRLGDYDNSYYTATVASMLNNAHNFMYASFDPAGVVMVDKPPVSFWIQAVPASILGVSRWSVTLPEAIIGTLAILLLYRVIRPTFGRLAAIISALVLAVVPASVVIDSRNEPDSLLCFILLLAGISIIRAVQSGKWRWLIIFAVLMGIGFNTKMLVAFVPLPAFLVYYILASKLPVRQLVMRVTSIIGVLLVASVWWLTLIALTPAENRPYVGSTPDNSIWTLTFEYNGINRFTSFIGPRPQNLPSQPSGQVYTPAGPPTYNNSFPFGPGGPPYNQSPVMNLEVPKTGLLGLLSNPLANQLGWLLPMGVISLLLAAVRALPDEVYRKPSGFPKLLRASPIASQAMLWTGWLATGLIVFGLASSTTTHPYYLVGVAIPMAATIGIGMSLLLSHFRNGGVVSWLLVAILVLMTGYQVYGSRTQVGEWTIAIVIAVALPTALVTALGLWRKLQTQPLTYSALAIGASVLLIIPLVSSWSAGGRIVGPNLRAPAPTLAPRLNPGESHTTNLTNFLTHESRSTDKITLGTVSAREAAPFIIAGVPSIAIGGFSGRDPIFTVESFRTMSEASGLRYFLMPDRDMPNRGRSRSQEQIMDHIRRYWTDSSRLAGLASGTLYQNPRSWSSS
ncbi:glycosyltransferase family 39 protein [Dehalococcoidia bacterium]|nr:glycosyltransferase family 39 protein [Dehalococcoidia bacterium]